MINAVDHLAECSALYEVVALLEYCTRDAASTQTMKPIEYIDGNITYQIGTMMAQSILPLLVMSGGAENMSIKTLLYKTFCACFH